MTLLDLMVFYRRAARAQHAYERMCARLAGIDLILMRLMDLGRPEPTDGTWNKAKARVVQIGVKRLRTMNTLRYEAQDRTIDMCSDEAEIAARLESVRQSVLTRKRAMS